MLTTLFTLLITIGAGRWLGAAKCGDRLLKLSRRLIVPLLGTVLFMIGLGIGQQPRIIEQIGSMGAASLVLALCCLLASAVSAPLAHLLLRHKDDLQHNDDETVSDSNRDTFAGAALLVCCVCLGAVATHGGWVHVHEPWLREVKNAVYCLLLTSIGLGLGIDRSTWFYLKCLRPRMLLLPPLVILGALAGSALASLAMPELKLAEIMSAGVGVGNYSISSAIAAKMSGPSLALIALMSNLLREIGTLLLSPLMARLVGPYGPIIFGGSTTIATTLSIVTSSSGKSYTVIAAVNGLILFILVPCLVTSLLKIALL